MPGDTRNRRGQAPRNRTSLLTAAVACVLYAAIGLITLQVSRYSGLAAALWPAAGIAFALVYQRGWVVAIGIAGGSFALNAWTLADQGQSSSAVAFTAAMVGIGAAAQALVGAGLVTRFVGSRSMLIDGRAIGLFLLLSGPVACLVNPTIGVGAELAAGVISPADAFLGWLTWWAGDTAGVLVFGPITLMLLPEQAAIWSGRRWKVAVPSVLVTMVLASAFVSNRDLDDRRMEMRRNQVAASAVADLEAEIDRHTEVLFGVDGLMRASESVSAEEFRTYTQTMLERFSDLQAVSWNPQVSGSALADFHATQRAQPELADYTVSERSADGTLVPVAPRSEYVVVGYIEPIANNRSALGFDIASNPTREAAIARARDTGEITGTAPVDLVQETGTQKGMLVLLPVYDGADNPDSEAARRSALRGFAVGVYRLDDFVDRTFEGDSWDGVQVVVTDVTDEQDPIEIGRNEPTQVIESAETVSAKLAVHGREWRVDVTPSDKVLGDVRTTSVPVLLVAGLLIIGLLEAFLLLVSGTERQARRQAQASDFDATHDPLTNLLNRRGFNRALQAAEERTRLEGEQHVLLYLDLDAFKAVNDRAGHDVGDDMLRLVAGVLQHSVRRRDVVARIGGDEFLVILNSCDLDRGLAIADQIVSDIGKAHIRVDEDELRVGVSIGIVPVVPEGSSDLDELVNAADRACLEAKRDGGRRVLLATT